MHDILIQDQRFESGIPSVSNIFTLKEDIGHMQYKINAADVNIKVAEKDESNATYHLKCKGTLY